MQIDSLRRSLVLISLSIAFLAGVAYDMLVIQTQPQAQMVLAALIAASLATVVFLHVWPAQAVATALIAAWPLHLFTVMFFWACFAWQEGRQLGQFAGYTVFAYATYLLVPLVLLLDREMFARFTKVVAATSALLAIPSFAGAAGMESFLGIPMRVKFSYAQFSGIAASAGLFEHAEGHAFQMAIGLFCSLYAWWRSRNPWWMAAVLLTLGGLSVSQGRAAIYGVGVAGLFLVLPELFRRSRPVFVITLVGALTGPYLILPQLAAIPGVAGYFRLERGLSGRSEAWRYAVELIREEPWKGHGFLASSQLTEEQRKILRKSGFSGAGTTFHNTFLTKAVELGVVVTAIYALLYVVPLLGICRRAGPRLEQMLVRSLILLTLTTSIYRDYNIGGIRSTAMLGAIFFGMANLWPWLYSKEDAAVPSSLAEVASEEALARTWRTEPAS